MAAKLILPPVPERARGDGASTVAELVEEAYALLRLANEQQMTDELRGWLHNAMTVCTFTIASAKGQMPSATKPCVDKPCP